jgi:hypothetical protein
MRPFNTLSDDERAALFRGPYGRELLKAIQPCVAPFYWTSRLAESLPSNGSAFIVKTSAALFGITARHVYDEYKEQVDQVPTAVCRLLNLEIDLRARLISRGNESDVVTFEIRPFELNDLNMQPAPWPPWIPKVNHAVIIAGFPGIGKRFTGSSITFGLYHALIGVDSVSDRDISMVRPPDDEVVDVVGKGLPPRGFDMGGMSGGPVIAVLEDSVVSWALSGVIYECGTNFEITKAVRADLIGEDGMIRE